MENEYVYIQLVSDPHGQHNEIVVEDIDPKGQHDEIVSED